MTAPLARPAPALRSLAAQMLTRAAGAPLIPGNRLELLRDARENFPAWLRAIESAERSICFECYIISDDSTGQRFAAALIDKARAGVKVRLLYDWVGCLRESGRRFYQPLRDAGVEVRCFNRPRFDDPFGWLSRDHRKMIAVDGRLGFVTGLCLSSKWEGNPARGVDPWRDTGVLLEGPAVVELESAFAEVWATTGAPIPPGELGSSDAVPSRGGVALRVIATAPATASVFRVDLMVASLAQKTLWLTDAYFMGVPTYVQALCNAAKDGVDVRLLVPGGSDVPLVSPLSRSGYRPLLEAGVRVFEWKGSMLHAKTAVVDSRWARVGSTNLNFQSWLGNYELDVAVEDPGFAQEMEVMYTEDLANATEIVLSRRARIQPITQAERRRWRLMQERGSGRAAAGALRLANSVGAAITSRRELGPAESKLMAAIGISLGLVSVLTFIWPRLVAIPLAIVLAWLALGSLARARRLRLTPPTSAQAPSPVKGATDLAPERLPDQPAPDLLR